MNNTTNKQFYENTINKYGVSAKGVHWKNQDTQYKRFEAISNFIKNDKSTLIDAGCGFGEYYKYLQLNNYKDINYIGYDCYIKMVDISKKRFQNIVFKHKDILNNDLEYADYYVCSGALNTLNKESIKLFIKRCFKYSKKAFIFNHLSQNSVSGFTKDELINYAKTLSSNIKVKDDYLENDFTIVIFN